MRSSKKIFWFSIIIFLLSLFLILISSCLDSEENKWDILLNVFISLIGGAFLSAATAFISFMQTKKDYEIKFYSNVNSLNNILLKILNWYNWDYDKLRYGTTIDTSKMTLEQAEQAHHMVFDGSDEKIKEFISLIVMYKEHNYDEMIYILDDYRGLFKNKGNKVKRIMIELRNELNNYNIDYHQSMINSYTLYEMGKIPEVAIYNDIVKPYLKETDIMNDKLNRLLEIRKTYLELTNLVEYTKKQQ